MALSWSSTTQDVRGFRVGALAITETPVTIGPPTITAETSTVSAITVDCTVFPTEADFVRLQYKADASSTWVDGQTGLTSADFPLDIEVGTTPAGGAWDVQAFAYNEYTESAASATVTANTESPVVLPTAPTLSNATAQSNSRIDITIAGGSGADSWEAKYRTPAGSGAYTTHGTVTIGATSYSFTGLPTADAEYDLKIDAINTAGTVASNVLTESTLADPVDNWQLADGHYVPRKMDLRISYPRPDAETAIWARHRNEYPGHAYEIPINIRGGSWPFKYELIDGPVGMTIGETMTQSGDVQIATADYGVLSWANPTAGTHSVTVRVYDQEYQRGANPSNYVEVTFSLVVATTRFLFIDPVNGNDSTGTGAIGAPFLTTLPLHSDSSATNTYSGKIVKLRAGTHNLVGMTGNSGNYRLVGTNQPLVWLGYPGENAKVVYLNSPQGFSFAGGQSDWYFGDVEIAHDPSLTSGSSQKMFRVDGSQARMTWFKLRCTRFNRGVAANDNAGIIYLGGVDRTDICVSHCEMTGQQGTFFQAYQVIDSVVERNEWHDCTISQFESASHGLIYLKDDPLRVSVRGNECWDNNTWQNGEFGFLSFGGQDGAEKVERCYNIGKNPLTGSRMGIFTDWSATAPFAIDIWDYRNSGTVKWNWEGSNGDTINSHTIEYNAWEGTALPSGVGLTVTNNAYAASGMFNSSMQLTGSNRTTYLGTHGAEIA
jgi:hypothetical protein